MQGASLILTSYQDSLARALDVVANNIANVTTSGFKREDVKFDSLISRPTPSERFVFGIDRATFRDFSPGPLQVTGNPLDIAIQGPGYFQIETKNGVRYTRGGSFQLNAAGEIVTGSGERLLGDGDQPIVVPEDAEDLLIGSDGIVSVKSGNGTSALQIGKLKTVVFADEQSLQPVGNGLYTSLQAPIADTKSVFVQGMVEQSNVKAVNEITRMIEIMRTYQQVIRMLEMEHQRQSTAIDRLSKTTL